MADTYYSYAERNASDEINWAQVGKNLTDMLGKEAQVREDKKAAIDKATTEYGNILANAPQGEHQGINQWALTYADSAQQARLMQDRLLKSGQLKQKDYMVMRQNITDGTKQAFNLINEYQAEYSDKMERYKKGDSQALEQWLMAEAEGFANFNNSELYINPTDFTVNVAKKEKQIVDGKEVYVMSKNPNDFTTVNAMRNRIKGKFDRLDVAKTLQAGVSVLGKEKDSLLKLGTLTQGGSITEIIDITKRKSFGVEAKEAVSLYERAENNYLDSIMVQPTNISSILTDYVGTDPKTKESYSYTWDASKAGGNVILLKNDSAGRPVPEFTEDQKKVAKDALRAKFRIMLDREVEIKPTAQAQLQERRPTTATEYEREDIKSDARNLADNLSKLVTGNTDQVDAALGYFGGLGVPIRRTQDGIFIRTKQGEVPYLYKDNTADDLVKALVSATNIKNLPEDMVVQFASGFNKKRPSVNLFSTGESIVGTPVQAPDITADITEDLFTSKSEMATKNLQSIIPDGFTVEDIGGVFGNDVEVTAPNKKKYTFNANLKESQIPAAKAGLAQFIKLNNVTSTQPAAATTTKPAAQNTTMKPGASR